MRFFQGALVAVVVLVVGCTGDEGAEGDGGGGGGGGDAGRGRGIGEAVAEAGPAPLVGQTDTDPDHWTEGEAWEPPSGLTTHRAYGGDVWSTVAEYPQAGSHCGSAQMRVSWRSLGGPLLAGLTTYPSYGEQQTLGTPEAPSESATANDGWVDVEADEPATEGQLVLNACEQPIFRTTEPNVLVDFVVEVTEHAPAA